MLIAIGVVAVIILLFVFFLFSTYTVVDPNEAHVVVQMGKGRRIYTPHVNEAGEKQPTAYFFVPFLMKREILPLANVKMELPGFALNDKEVAPFQCEVTCWFRIKDPSTAIEKLDIRDGNFELAVKSTLEEQVRGVARAAAMKQEILDIMRDRKTFGEGVETEVNGALEEWGLELVKLEIVDFSDVEGSTVIEDYEKKREAQIRSESRQEIAVQDKRAKVVESENFKEGEMAKVEAEREVKKSQIEMKKQTEIADQSANQSIQEAKQKTNAKQVEAEKTLEVGKANYEKEAIIVRADAAKAKAIKEGEGTAEAEKIKGYAAVDVQEKKGMTDAAITKAQGLAKADADREQGLAEAKVVEEKGKAQAVGTDKQAEALKKYNDAGINLEIIKASKDVMLEKARALGEAIKAANIQVVQGGGDESIFGMLDVSPEKGAGIAQFVNAFKNSLNPETKEAVTKAVKAVTTKQPKK